MKIEIQTYKNGQHFELIPFDNMETAFQYLAAWCFNHIESKDVPIVYIDGIPVRHYPKIN